MSLSFVKLCTEAFARGIRPEPDLTVSQWAAEYRILSQTSSAEPGLWRNERTPYLVEIMDSLSPYSGVEQVSVMKGAQIGASECGNNWVGFVIHHAPGPMLYIQPTVETVKRYSQIRLAPMIAACKELAERVSDNKSRDSSNTLFLKSFPGGTLILGGANSAVGLRSMPIRFLFLDECDAYPQDVDGEGDPIELAEKRTATFRNRKIFKISTPTLVGLSHIEKAYNAGDRRKWFMPCPFCGERFVLRWRFETDEEPGGIVWVPRKPQTAQYQCHSCERLIPEHRKTWMLSQGSWRATSLECDPKIRSYHLPSLVSPYGWPGASWPELAKRWEAGSRDPVKLKVFFNTELGLPYEDTSTRSAEPVALLERCEQFPPPLLDGTIVAPNDIAVITLGADVQQNRIEYEIVGWGKGEESWSLAYGVILGDTSTSTPFNDLDRILLRPIQNDVGIKLRVHASCVDVNFNTQTGTAWAGPRFGRKIWAVRGSSGKRAIWPRLPGKSKYNSTPLFTVGVDAAKEAIISRLTIVAPGPGYSHFPTDRDEDYFGQLTSEVCVTVYDKTPPQQIWKKRTPTARNEALDIRVYAYAALCGLIAGGLRLDAEAEHVEQEVEKRKLALLRMPSVVGTTGRSVRFQMNR